MHDFTVREIITDDIKSEIDFIGFDKSYSKKVCDKFDYKNLKIYSLTPAQANILKQTALSVGADCATHREVITGKIENSDCILGGSVSQIKKIAEKLKFQPFGLKYLGELLKTGGTPVKNTRIMGILNITDNSFSDGGEYLGTEKAYKHLVKMVEEGADIIDIGAESTKPYSKPVLAEVQLERILPVLERVVAEGVEVPISIDTRSSRVAQECIKRGAKIINDVSGLTYDEKMAEVIAAGGVQVVLQHSKGSPENMQVSPYYDNLMDEIFLDLKYKIDFAVSKGISKDNIIVDPGIGFGKTREHNFEILRRVGELRRLGCPILLGLSRKSMLNMPDADNLTKDIFTAALNTLAVEQNVDIIRVHNVGLHKQLIKMLG